MNQICGICLKPWDEHHRCQPAQENPAIEYAHRLAIMLECALLDPVGSFSDASNLLDEYKLALYRWNHALGEHYVSGFGKD